MAARWQYSRWQRVTMQLVMWGVMCASVGVAALVTQRQNRDPVLGEEMVIGQTRIRPPIGWTVTRPTEGQPAPVLHMLEPGPDGTTRSITLVRHPIEQLISPLEYLQRRGLRASVSGHENAQATSAMIPFAQYPGVLVTAMRRVLTVDAERGPSEHQIKDVVACTVLPTREVAVLHLTGLGPLDRQDLNLVTAIARQATLTNPSPAPDSVRTLVLAGGITVGVPPGLVPDQQADNGRTARLLISHRPDAPWIGVELIPCLVVEQSPDNLDLLAMAALHEEAFVGGIVSATGNNDDDGDAPNHWRLLPRGGAAPFPLVAHVHRDTSGLAVLGILRAGEPGNNRLDSLWAEFEHSLTFDSSPPVAQWLKAGERVAQELAQIGVRATLESQIRSDAGRWWMWTRDHGEPYVGWMYERVVDGRDLNAARETRLRNGDGSVCRSIQQWTSDDRMTGYALRSTRNAMMLDPAARDPVVHQVVVDRGQLKLDSPAGGASHRDCPRAFVPGGWLPMLIGAMPDEPVVLKTESFPGCQAAATGGLLTVLIEPTPERPREADDGKPLRCLRVTLSGTGELMYWYMDATGQVQIVDLPDGMHMHPTDAERIRMNFDNVDRRMLPASGA